MNKLKDVIVVDTDPEKFAALAELFGRKELGEKLSGRFEATLAENGEGVAVLAIDEIKFEVAKGKVKPEKEDEDDASPAVRVFKGKRQEAVSEDQETS